MRLRMQAMPSLQSVISCLSDYDPTALPVSQANAIIGNVVEPVRGIEQLALRSALDRVLAQDVISSIDVPAHDNSAMDGYAFPGTALAHGDTVVELDVIGTAYAGSAFHGTTSEGQAVRIMTGAIMPDGCDTVVPQEFVEVLAGGNRIRLAADAVRVGDNRRLRGEDLARGQAALHAGHPDAG